MNYLLKVTGWFLLLLICPLSSAYESQGATLANMFPVATSAGREGGVAAAFDGTNFLVGIQGDEFAYNNISAQLVSATGTLIGPRISVDRTGGFPSVAFDGINYLMVWEDDALHLDNYIYGQFISKAGLLVGSSFIISSSKGIKDYIDIGFDGTNYLVVWSDFRNDKNYNEQCDTGEGTCTDIYGQFITPAGDLHDSEIPISIEANSQRVPELAFDGSKYLVVWESRRSGPELWDIKGRFISKSGTLSDSFITSSAPSTKYNPLAVVFDGNNYLVAWNYDSGGGEWDIAGQLVDTAGNKVDSMISVTTASGHQFGPSIAYNGINYLVSWTDMRYDLDGDWICDTDEGTCMDIYGQYISRSGGLTGSEFIINEDAGNQLGGVGAFVDGKYFGISNTGITLDPLEGEILFGDVYWIIMNSPTNMATAVRNLPDYATPDTDVTVSVSIDVDESNAPNGLIVNEYVPSGWMLVSASPNYESYDQSSGKISWLFFGNISDKSINYAVHVPASETISAVKCFNGNLPYNDSIGNPVTETVGGDQCITIGYHFHPYDANQDWVIGDFELLDAIDAWAGGKLGDFELLDLIDYWAFGSYCWDSSAGSHKAGTHDEYGACQ